MKKTFKALDENLNLELEFTKIDFLNSEDVIKLLKSVTDNCLIVASKSVNVYARPSKEGEVVDTRKRFDFNGQTYFLDNQKRVIETRDAENGAIILSFANNQQALITGENFMENYLLADSLLELYTPISTPRHFVTVTKNIYFYTPRGEYVFAPIGSKLCVDFLLSLDFYVFTNSEFKATYEVLEEGGDLDNLL